MDAGLVAIGTKAGKEATATFVERKLDSVKKLSDQTTQQVEMLLHHCMR